jgi:hypothetical protein
VHRTSSLALWAAAFTTTCVPPADLTGATERQAAPAVEAPAPIRADSADVEELADTTTPVILVVLDGVRWQEVFSGIDPALAAAHRAGPVTDARTLLPSLYAALDTRGAAVGAPGHGLIAASGPNFVSLPGYTEIFGGRSPEHCRDNGCAGATSPTIVDAMRARSRSDSDVAVIASWAPIGRAATAVSSRIVLSAGRDDVTGGRILAEDPQARSILDEGSRADPRPGHDSFRPDRYTSALALRYLEVWRPSFLFVGLGEPDEYAHLDDYRGYIASLRAADEFFGRLFVTLDRMGDRGRRSLVLVTADHGRGRDYRDHGGALPESARVWLLAFGGPVRAQGFVDGPQPRRLADIAPTIRQVVGLPVERTYGSGTPMFELLSEAQPELAR